VSVHKDPGIDAALPFTHSLPETLQKFGSILIVHEDWGFIDAAHHDMMQGAEDVQSRLPWHEAILSKAIRRVKYKACYEPASHQPSSFALVSVSTVLSIESLHGQQ
jgi:hypothetical protein